MISIVSLSRYNSYVSLETSLCFVYDMIKGDLIVELYEAGQWVNIIWSSVLSEVY